VCDRIRLVFRRIALVLGRHADVLRGAPAPRSLASRRSSSPDQRSAEEAGAAPVTALVEKTPGIDMLNHTVYFAAGRMLELQHSSDVPALILTER
jgi:hypothetical protein